MGSTTQPPYRSLLVASSPSVESLIHEVDCTLQWNVYLIDDGQSREAGDYERLRGKVIPGFVSQIAEGSVPGPIPQDWHGEGG